MNSRILIIDDEPNIAISFRSLLADEGYSCETADSVEDGHRLLCRADFDLILLDLQLPGASGLDMLRQLKADGTMSEVLVISGQADIPMALEAIRLGAADFLEKPVPPERLIVSVSAALKLAEANRQRAMLLDELNVASPMTGDSAAMTRMKAEISTVAPTDTNVLITGDNGTGKELVATRLYLASQRRGKPFVKVNCPGIPETLFESELFGHMKGSFTGAVKDYPGRFIQADGGTIFLDEIGDLPLSCQAKLLRVLESGVVETLGAERTRTVDVRIICATNRDLAKQIEAEKFRQDLFYRISVMVITLPSLHERREDIPLLVGNFLKRFDPSGATEISADAIAWLTTLDYPGNVRQLKNLIERLCILFYGKRVSGADIQTEWNRTLPTAPVKTDSVGGDKSRSLSGQTELFEKTLISSTLAKCDGNISEAAKELKIDRGNLSKKISYYRLKKS